MVAIILRVQWHFRLVLPDDFTRANVPSINLYTGGFDRIIFG